MKTILIAFTALISFSAFATTPAANTTDTKVGNMIAISRQIDDLYNTCLANVTDDTTKPSYMFACVIPVAQENELLITNKHFVSESNSRCMTDGYVQNGKIMITFGNGNNQGPYNEAKNCLLQGLMKNNTISVTLFVIDSASK